MTQSLRVSALNKAIDTLKDALRHCRICPRRCGADRLSGDLGYCRAAIDPRVYSYFPHQGEEPPISGTRGSGTIFFSHCNMKCAYCQNYEFSQLDKGEDVSTDRLAGMMLDLQGRGCHNINLVTPTHYLPQILLALRTATDKGLALPIVYNTSGYELPETISLLDGIVDIYLVDMRYSSEDMARKYSDAANYVKHNRPAVGEMLRQAGHLSMDDSGIARKGLIVRLLCIPEGTSGTVETLRFIKDKLGSNTHISLMSQYFPAHRASGLSEISRPISPTEYQNIVDEARLLGLNNGWIQDDPDELDHNFRGTNIRPL